MTTLLYVIVVALAGFLVGRYRADLLQNRGEALLRRVVQANFAAPDYFLLNNITLRLKDGTTQVDHVLVSRFGIFEIETKDYKGWIFANPKQASWTQVFFKRKFHFQNPIFQNLRHIRAVQECLDFVQAEFIHSTVVFTGEAEFRTPVPDGVFTLPRFVEHIRGHTSEVLSENRVQFCVGRLETTRLALTRKTDVEHVRDLQRRHGGAA